MDYTGLWFEHKDRGYRRENRYSVFAEGQCNEPRPAHELDPVVFNRGLSSSTDGVFDEPYLTEALHPWDRIPP